MTPQKKENNMADASIKTERTGKVQTVLGLIDPADLGITLTHEHILVDQRDWIDKPVTLDRLGGVTSRFYNLDSMVILEEKAAVEETFKFKLAGGGSLVDVTSIGIGRDPLALARISRATGLNLIMGGGHYVPWAHPPGMDEETEESITEALIKDINVGVYEDGRAFSYSPRLPPRFAYGHYWSSR
jgi:phosphotriesterase-related protein